MTLHGSTTGFDRPHSEERSRSSWDDVTRAVGWDDVSRVLGNDRRREILRCVLEADEEVTVKTLTSRIADAEYDATLGSTLLEQRQRVHAALRRTHLPLLEECGLVEYERLQGLVFPANRLPELESALE